MRQNPPISPSDNGGAMPRCMMTDRSIGNHSCGNDHDDDDLMSAVMRDYRKGNWTLTETMVLIEAKKMDDERRSVKRSPGTGGKSSMEPRWKWVEDYCWRRGCYRSQNQCNDKWDNLMRDYKKVRDHERRRRHGSGDGGGGGDDIGSSSSYWKMDKAARKDSSLPTNMIPQIYDVLAEVVERKAVGGGSGGGSAATATTAQLLLPGIPSNAGALQPMTLPCPLPQPQIHYIPPTALFPVPVPPALPLPTGLPPPLSREGAAEPPQPSSETGHRPLTRAESEDTSEGRPDSPAKRRRTARGQGDSGMSDPQNIGTAISRSVTIIADAIQAKDEREERRHRDMVSLQERRLKIKESKNEISRQGIDSLAEAINRLAASVQALASSSSPASKSNNNNNEEQPPA